MEKIIFKNQEDNLEFRLSIVGYEFPHIESDYDGNWLIVKYECYYKEKYFTIQDSSLLTVDLLEISNWFDSISKNQIPENTSLCFIEPNIEFILCGKKNNLIQYGIKLDAESEPSFRIREFDNDFIMYFKSSFDELKIYANSFKKLYKKYPQKGELY